MASKRVLQPFLRSIPAARASPTPSLAAWQPQRPSERGRQGSSMSELHTSAKRGKGSGHAARTDPSVRSSPATEHDIQSRKASSEEAVRLTLPSFSLAGRKVVVTGGARGLGLVMGQAIVASGGDLAIVDLNVDEGKRQAASLTSQFASSHPSAEQKPKITAHHADVSDATSVSNCVDEIVAAHGKIDGLVTSAGFVENIDATEYGIDRVRALFGVNFDGTYLFATAVARHLMKRKAEGSSMVLIGSMSGNIVNVPQPQAPYNASKAAVRMLAASLAVEWAPAGIRVNCISPGYMLTPLTKKILDEKPELREKWVNSTPMGRMGDPTDLMGPVTFLLSDASRYMTGADVRVDGGYTIV